MVNGVFVPIIGPLNAVIIKDRSPASTMDDILDELHGAAYFILTAGYHQI